MTSKEETSNLFAALKNVPRHLADAVPQSDKFRASRLLAADNAIAAAKALDGRSPVEALTDDAFKELLTMVVATEVLANGGIKTKTNHELARWLEVLNGTRTKAEFLALGGSLWVWTDLVHLGISPLVAFCYMRMVRESREA